MILHAKSKYFFDFFNTSIGLNISPPFFFV